MLRAVTVTTTYSLSRAQASDKTYGGSGTIPEISMDHLSNSFGGIDPVRLSEYYVGSDTNNDIINTAFNNYSGDTLPSSGDISLSDFIKPA